MDERAVVTCFLGYRGGVLPLRRSDAVGSYAGRWSGVAGHVAIDRGAERALKAAPRAEIREETGTVCGGSSSPVDSETTPVPTLPSMASRPSRSASLACQDT